MSCIRLSCEALQELSQIGRYRFSFDNEEAPICGHQSFMGLGPKAQADKPSQVNPPA